MGDMFRLYENYSTIIKFKELEEPEETWELLDLIGEGTYGEVYSVKNKQTGEIAAVKILESIHEIIEEIEEEYTILKDCHNHRNMPKFYGLYLKTGETGKDDQLWIVMEYCSRGSVTDLAKSLLEKRQKMDEPMLAHIMKEALMVLMYLHKKHIIHRDIKGHNILLTDKGDIKLIDFGVSGHLKSTLDKKKTSVGTPFWMAPEVIACEQQLEYDYDIRCDIWSLGITCIELIDGEPPLAAQNPMRALFKIPRNPPPTMKNPDQWSHECRDFVARCLTKDSEQRPFAWDLLEHPFVHKAPDDVHELKERIVQITSQNKRIIQEPHVTTKQGRLKSHKSRHGPPPTTDDLTKLEVLDDESIVAQLFTRYTQNIIYTYIGDILLAVNPFTTLNIYGHDYSEQYMHAAKADNPPHIFAIADQAYQMMVHQRKHQCIVISGESGAGKTESANFLVQQLTQLGKASNKDLEEKILQVNPLMEAFGNARTVINDNSSRFGKYLEMLFTDNGTVTGAKITEYLLEKSRVIFQAQGEQNFHIFYYVHDGLPSDDKTHKYHLKENENFRYISEYTAAAPDVVTMSMNRIKFKDVMHCFEIIGFKQEEVSSIIGIIAAILHIGNVEFVEKKSQKHSGDCVQVHNTSLTENVAKLMGVESNDLIEVLTTTGMVARGEIIIRENTTHEALDVRDAMSKSLYGRLFSWIVNKINVLLEPDKKIHKQDSINIIGLLDIFGFENFPSNSFEQLCINIANEQIQYYFNQHIFEWELQEYKNEGINGNVIAYVDNRSLLDMFLAKPMGLLALLDEESHFPKASDWTLVDKFHQNIKSPYYSRPKATSLYFSIDHYAGQVQYDGTGFLEKNRDRLPVEVVNLLRASDNLVIRALFQAQLTKTGNLASASLKNNVHSQKSPSSTSAGFTVLSLRTQSPSSMGGSKGSSAASMTRIQQTVATYFRFSLNDLLAKLVAGIPHFVRCLRPNEANVPEQFNLHKVKIQLKYTGVLETTRIRREGFSHRVPYVDFVKRYSLLALGQSNSLTPNVHGCHLLLKLLGLTDYALGKTKVFLKFYHAEYLARKYTEVLQNIVKLQAYIRMVLSRKQYYNFKWKVERAILLLQKYVRGWIIRAKYNKIFKRRQQNAVIIQKVVRGYLTRKKVIPELQRRKAAAVKIQAVYRGHKGRMIAKQEKIAIQNSVLKIQTGFRDENTKANARHVNSQESAAIQIQSWYRMQRCKHIYTMMLKYKEHKDLQMIYFGQQVDAYSNDLLLKLKKTNMKAKLVPEPDISVTALRQTQSPLPLKHVPNSPKAGPSSPIDGHVKNSMHLTKSVVTKQPIVNIEILDIGQERKQHLRKMMESKSILLETEMCYYTSANMKVEETKCNEKGKNASSSAKKKLKQVLEEDTESYYSSVVQRSADLSDSREEQLDLGETAATIASKLLSDWDEPLKYARQQVLSAKCIPIGQKSSFSTHNFKSNPTVWVSHKECDRNSSNLHVDISKLQGNQTTSINNFQFFKKVDQSDIPSYANAYSSLPSANLACIQKAVGPSMQNTEYGKRFLPSLSEQSDCFDVNSDLVSTSAENSLTSQHLALSLLDEVIEGASSPRVKSTSTSLNTKMKDQMARVVAEAISANPEMNNIGHHFKQLVEIEEDFKTDRDEFYAEANKYELLNTLEEEYSRSAKGKWFKLQNLISKGLLTFNHHQSDSHEHLTSVASNDGPMISVTTSDGKEHRSTISVTTYHRPGYYNDMSSASDNLTTRPPTVPVSNKTNVISVGYVNGQITSNGFHQTSMQEQNYPRKTVSKVKFSTSEPTIIDVKLNKNIIDTRQGPPSSVVNFHNLQTNTNINIEKLLTDTNDSEKPVYDFRRMLRKTGRLEKIAQQPL